jgi:hypothetical protein
MSGVAATIKENTAVSLSLVVTFFLSLAGSIYYIVQVSALAQSNHRAIQELERVREYSTARIYDRLYLIEGSVGTIRADVAAGNAKLDLLIKLQQSEIKQRRDNP